MDLQVPAKLGAPSGTIDLGTVVQNSLASYILQIANVADVARFPLRVADRMAGVGHLQSGEVPDMGVDDGGEGTQRPRTLGGC